MLRCLLGKPDGQEFKLVLSFWKNMVIMYAIFNILSVLERSHMVAFILVIPGGLFSFTASLSFIIHLIFLLFCILTIYFFIFQVSLPHLPYCFLVKGGKLVSSHLEHGANSQGSFLLPYYNTGTTSVPVSLSLAEWFTSRGNIFPKLHHCVRADFKCWGI